GVASEAQLELSIAEPATTSGLSRYFAVPSGSQATTGSSAAASLTFCCCVLGSTQSAFISSVCTSGVIQSADHAGWASSPSAGVDGGAMAGSVPSGPSNSCWEGSAGVSDVSSPPEASPPPSDPPPSEGIASSVASGATTPS